MPRPKTLTDIPPVTRDYLIDVPREHLLTPYASNTPTLWLRSSGSTTGTPFVWGAPMILWIGDEFGHYVRELEDSGLPLKAYARPGTYLHFNYAGTYASCKFIFGGDFSARPDDTDLEEKIRAFSAAAENVGGVLLRTVPSELVFLVQKLEEFNLHPPILYCSVTGQILEEDVRSYVEQYLNCPVVSAYGTQEIAIIGFECRKQRGSFHIAGERVVVDLVDEDGNSVPEGEAGHVTITSLDNFTMPLLRYQPGDIGRFRPHSCGCRNVSPLPTLTLEGRASDYLQMSDGSKLMAGRVARLFRSGALLPFVRRVQIKQDAIDSIHVLIELRGAPLPDTAVSALLKGVKALNPILTCTVSQVQKIEQEGRKFKVFVPLKTS